MDPIQSWLDAKEVRRMAESLMAPAPEVDQAALDAGYGKDFEGFASAKPLAQVAPEQFSNEEAAHAPQHAVEPDFPQENLPEDPSQGVGTTARIVVSHALADAKRLAEGSGMLSNPQVAEPANMDMTEVALNPSTPVADRLSEPTDPDLADDEPFRPLIEEKKSPAPSQGIAFSNSPFQLCQDQSPDDDVPIARQIDDIPTFEDEVKPEPEPELIEPPATEPLVENIETEPKVVLPPAPQKPTPPASGAARGPFLTRLKRFSGLLRERLDARSMFLIDNEGQILIDEVGNAKLVQVARTLANASHTAARQTNGAADVGNLHVKIGASATLEVIPCRSRYGLLILGVVCDAPLGAERVRQVAEYLAKTVDPDGGV
ncbi:hypothetical protein NT6N_17040 [Oceaniferula spumae]|uniref:Roadblock/LAMTOR2 domain-containing protein n=1 Tax=Oceaniferula spumae TaxID=2979115 RepID=A0AAT9FL36_9BACT